MEPTDQSNHYSRRHFGRLTMAALGGAVMGSLASGCRSTPAKPASGGPQAALLWQEPHVCRGLNTCRGKGAGGGNQCAGQGDCATAAHHSCQTQNECKGQGGCGSIAGQNDCKGRGACSVPLRADTWVKARAAFEKQALAAGVTVGAAPE